MSGYWLTGDMTVAKCGDLIDAVIKAMNMEKAHGSIVWHYPVAGKGGEGFSLCQPITTSLVTIDAWPKAEIPHASLIIQSCIHFNDSDVVATAEAFGYKIRDKFNNVLG